MENTVKSGFWNGKNPSPWFAAPHENCSLFFQWLHTSSSAIVDLEMWWKRKKKKKFQSMYFFFPQSLDAHRKNRESWVQIAYWDERWDYKRAEIFYLKSKRNIRWSRCWGSGTCFRIISFHFWSLYILQSSSSLVTRIAWEARETAFTNH